jgi:uncharacterized protein YndB with AHSA1/START domain
MVKSSRTRDLNHQYLIRAPPRTVFRAITEPRQLVRWLCDRASFEPKTNGRYSVGWTNGPTHTGRVLRFTADRGYTLSWEWPGVSLRTTRFRLTVKPAGRSSLFVIEHLRFPSDPKWFDLYAGAEWGWTYFAMNLKSVLETGKDLRSPRDG